MADRTSVEPATHPDLSVPTTDNAPEAASRRKYVAFVLELPALRLLRQVELPDSPATCMAVSPDQNQLAIGTKDARIVVLGCDRDYSTHCVCMANSVTGPIGHNGPVACLDWDVTSKYFRTNSLSPSHEVLHWGQEHVAISATSSASSQSVLFSGGAEKKRKKSKQLKYKVLASATLSTKKIIWATHTCVITWGTRGLWPFADDGTRIHSVDVTAKGKMVVAGDASGVVRVCPYPANVMTTGVRLPGHWCSIRTVRFSSDSQALFSVTSAGEVVYQWHVRLPVIGLSNR
eukprot:INCI13413.12.p1 GENE.INCI13413.12~~INCI13413.12.p1  ORF type:complete len:289 (-),score=24.95 INCI13413.12:605-1471(-)